MAFVGRNRFNPYSRPVYGQGTYGSQFPLVQPRTTFNIDRPPMQPEQPRPPQDYNMNILLRLIDQLVRGRQPQYSDPIIQQQPDQPHGIPPNGNETALKVTNNIQQREGTSDPALQLLQNVTDPRRIGPTRQAPGVRGQEDQGTVNAPVIRITQAEAMLLVKNPQFAPLVQRLLQAERVGGLVIDPGTSVRPIQDLVTNLQQALGTQATPLAQAAPIIEPTPQPTPSPQAQGVPGVLPPRPGAGLPIPQDKGAAPPITGGSGPFDTFRPPMTEEQPLPPQQIREPRPEPAPQPPPLLPLSPLNQSAPVSQPGGLAGPMAPPFTTTPTGVQIPSVSSVPATDLVGGLIVNPETNLLPPGAPMSASDALIQHALDRQSAIDQQNTVISTPPDTGLMGGMDYAPAPNTSLLNPDNSISTPPDYWKNQLAV